MRAGLRAWLGLCLLGGLAGCERPAPQGPPPPPSVKVATLQLQPIQETTELLAEINSRYVTVESLRERVRRPREASGAAEESAAIKIAR